MAKDAHGFLNGGRSMNKPTVARYLSLVVLLCACVPMAACVSRRPDSCKRVDIDSAGEFCLDTLRILGIAPGAGGLDGTAHYVVISPPVTPSDSFKDVSQVILMAELPSMAEPPCGTGGIGFRCIAKVPDTPLQVMVVFQQPGEGHFIERTRALARDAGHNVIKQWHKE